MRGVRGGGRPALSVSVSLTIGKEEWMNRVHHTFTGCTPGSLVAADHSIPRFPCPRTVVPQPDELIASWVHAPRRHTTIRFGEAKCRGHHPVWVSYHNQGG